MSQSAPIGAIPAARPEVREAIARASQATGVDFSYLLGQAKIESSLDPSAHAATSSAAGLYQFTGGTWLEMLRRHGDEHGLGWASAAIEDGSIANPAIRQQLLGLRYDPDASAAMAAELASDNSAALTRVLGRAPDAAELYMAHFLGTEGAEKFLSALAVDPSQGAAALLPKAAAANRAIFFNDAGSPRSLGEVMDLMRNRLSAAMDSTGYPPENPGGAWAAATGQAGQGAAGAAPPPRPSMAETLAATFGANGAAMPEHVRAAYDKLQAFGL